VKAIYDLFSGFGFLLARDHYQFDKESPKRKNCIEVIYRFDYHKYLDSNSIYMLKKGEEIAEDLIQLLNEVAPEKNAIVDKFSSFGMKSEVLLKRRPCCSLRMSIALKR
jgi:hypothetical protein